MSLGCPKEWIVIRHTQWDVWIDEFVHYEQAAALYAEARRLMEGGQGDVTRVSLSRLCSEYMQHHVTRFRVLSSVDQ